MSTGPRTEVAETWAKDRISYPGWVIGPVRQTHSLTYIFPTSQKGPETPEAHLRFAAESIWRHRTACIWISQTDLKDADQHYEAGRSLSSSERIALCAACATEWRRFQDWTKWSVWMERLQAISSEEARLAHAYEAGQRALLQWDDAAILTAANSLKSEEPLWMMRRASLQATLYHHREAVELYQAALLRIRQKQVSDPRSAWLISLEGWAAVYHSFSKSALNDGPNSSPEGETDETRMRFLGAKADPWDTISRFDNLTTERIDRNRKDNEPWSLSFKPGSYRHGGTTRVSGDTECPFYGLLELMERTGAPETISNFNLFSTRLETAYRAITDPDEDDFMAFLACYRGTDKKILDWVLPRTKVAQLSVEAVEQLLDGIPKRVERLRTLNDNRTGNAHLAFLLEVVARIVIRAASKKALELFMWAISLFDKPVIWWGGYAAGNAVMEAAVEAMTLTDRRSALLVFRT